jgi:hypothetical protein
VMIDSHLLSLGNSWCTVHGECYMMGIVWSLDQVRMGLVGWLVGWLMWCCRNRSRSRSLCG